MALSQADLKRYRALQQKKFRSESMRFIVQGRKVVAELLASGFQTEILLTTQEALASVKPFADERKIPVEVLPSHELDKIGTFEKGNELIAVVVEPAPVPFRLPAKDELMLALDGVRDPRNMGGLLRIADWYGIKRVICSHDCMEIYNPKAVQSTMGSLFHVELRRANLLTELTQYANAGVNVYIADMDGMSIYEAELTRPAVLVLGSESHGHSHAVESMKAKVVSIPRMGQAESLNVAMAAAALCTEFARQATIK